MTFNGLMIDDDAKILTMENINLMNNLIESYVKSNPNC